jgi:hypothetical protein
MPGRWTERETQLFREEVQRGGSWRAVLGRLLERFRKEGIDRRISQGALQNRASFLGLSLKAAAALPDDPQSQRVEVDLGKDAGTVTTRSLDVKTLEDALRIAEVDEAIWEVERHVVNSWEVTMNTDDGPRTLTNWQVKVWLRRKTLERRSLELLIRDLPSAKPIRPMRRKTADDGCLCAVGLYDHHFGMLCWAPEVGADYDLKVARRLYVRAMEDLLSRAMPFGISKILLVIGQDFFHVNDPQGVTPRHGNELDVEGRLPKIIAAGKDSVIGAAELAAQVAPVEVKWVPGNHDPESSYWLSLIIEERFRNDDRITVDVSPCPRKYVKHGVCLLGLTHGMDEPIRQLPAIMAMESPEWWAATTHRAWLTGHFHRKKEERFTALEDVGGVSVVTLPSLAAKDAWHFKKGYNSARSAEAYLWHESDGYAGHVAAFASNLMEE